MKKNSLRVVGCEIKKEKFPIKIEKFPKTLLDKDFLGSVQMLYLLGKFSRF